MCVLCVCVCRERKEGRGNRMVFGAVSVDVHTSDFRLDFAAVAFYYLTFYIVVFFPIWHVRFLAKTNRNSPEHTDRATPRDRNTKPKTASWPSSRPTRAKSILHTCSRKHPNFKVSQA